MTPGKLQSFCSKEPWKESLLYPWNANGFTYASNGFVGIRITEVEGYGNKGPDLETLLAKARTEDIFGLSSLPEIEMVVCAKCQGTGKATDCDHCDGEGEVEFRCEHSGCYETYTFECHECGGSGKSSEDGKCEECDGIGKVESKTKLKFGNRTFYVSALRMIYDLPELKLEKDGGETSGAYFTFDEGEGLIMPCKD